MAIGPTGEFRLGAPMQPGDQGGLYAALGRVPGMRALRLDFGTELSWLSVSPQEALMLARSYRAIVQRYYGNLSYDASTLPIRVKANHAKNIVECTFHVSVGVLVANPEVYLAWADRLAEAAKELGQPVGDA